MLRQNLPLSANQMAYKEKGKAGELYTAINGKDSGFSRKIFLGAKTRYNFVLVNRTNGFAVAFFQYSFDTRGFSSQNHAIPNLGERPYSQISKIYGCIIYYLK
jgi:hypothetical protein